MTLLTGVFLAVCPTRVCAITPDSPRVHSAVARALAYLEGSQETRLGGKALIGLAFVKSGRDPSHPKIVEAVRAIKAALRNGPEKFRAGIYDTGLSIMFLVAADPSLYRFEIESLVRSLHLRQKAHGAWGYPVSNERNGKTCDTSMTQYAVLGLWEAEDQAGIETPRLVWDRVALWLLLTQDSKGGFAYQGHPAARLGRFEKQSGVRDSMTIAALGSLYVVKDRVGITQLKKPAHDDTPDALVPYESQEERAARLKTQIDRRYFARALANGNRWIETNVDVDALTGYPYYALYALERYESLREADAAGRAAPQEKTDRSKWYNRGAKFLLHNQNSDGSWEGQTGLNPSTAFGALFLMGSTRKTLAAESVAHYAASNLIGGKGIPNAKNVRVRRGQVVPTPLDKPLEQVLQVLRDPKNPSYAAALETLADAARTQTARELSPHVSLLLQLALTASQSQAQREARLLAIRCLRHANDLDHVPWLIHLLSDEDTQVAFASAEALSQLSRKFDTLGFTRRPSDRERDAAIERWKAWYRDVRPDVDLDAFSFLQPVNNE